MFGKRNVRDLVVGDRVTIRWNGIEGFAVVAEVGKLKVKTDDGKVWKRNGGYKWGSPSYCGPYIDPYEPSDDTELAEQRENRKRQILAQKFREFDWRSLSIEKLLSVKAIITDESASPEAANGDTRPLVEGATK